MRACECIPMCYFKIIHISEDVPTCPDPRLVVERGANMCPGNAVEKHENTNLGALLWEAYAPGTAADGLVQVK